MGKVQRYERGGKRIPFSIKTFPESIRQLTAFLCAIFLLQFLWTPLEARPSGGQVQLLKKATPFVQKSVAKTLAFSISGTGEANFALTVGSAGKISATATWTGSASSLSLILNGPGQTQFYARRDGGSPLSLEYDLTPELLQKGNGWRISLVSFKADIAAQGQITFHLPPGSSVSQLSGQPTASAQKPAATAVTGTPAATTSGTASSEKIGTSTSKTTTTTATPKPSLKDLLSKKKTETQPVVPAEAQEDLSAVQKDIEAGIERIARQSALGPVVVPLFFKYLEELGDNPRLVREFFRDSAHKTTRDESELARRLQRPVRAYKQIPREFKARYLHPALVDLKKGDRIEFRTLGREVIQKINPGLEGRVKQVVRESFSGRYLLTKEQVLAGQKITPVAGMTRVSAQKKSVRTAVQSSQPRAQMASASLPGLSSRPTEAELNNLKQALEQAGANIPATLTRGSLVHELLKASGATDALRQIDGRKFEADYYRYLVTLDWFRCLDKNERSDDEPYFGVLTTLPQFDPGDTNYFKFLKDGCLNQTDSYVTRTYGDVKKNTDHGIKGDDRIIFDYLTFNSPASFTIDLWEEDFSKGAVSDGLRAAALDIMLKIKNDLKAAVISQIQTYIADAILSSSGLSSSAAMQLLNQIFSGNLGFADFQNLLFNLYSGRAFDASWYLIYFLFSGGDLMQTLAMVGGGSTVVGAVILGLAIVGPAFSDMISAFSSGDVNTGLVNLFKIITVLPLLADFFGSIVRSLIDLFYMIMALVDPDDHLGQKTVVIQQTSANWHNDAKDGDWASGNLMGAVPINEADRFFAQRGYGPTRFNSSFVENNLFWVPGFTIKGGDAEYNVYYEVFRERAGGRTTFGFYFPEKPDLNLKKIVYQSKSSPAAWWTNVLKVSVMSVNTQETPLVFITDKKDGKTYSNAETGNIVEIEQNPGTEYEIWVMKLSAGEMAGYLSIYEGPEIEVLCPEAKSSGGPGAGTPPGSRRTHLK
ncbi:MAG TPA: hypothetical protein DCR87_04630 [Acidobacteria bacterium]|nr:hypothetical protein [Acidobacteriota bacterium]